MDRIKQTTNMEAPAAETTAPGSAPAALNPSLTADCPAQSGGPPGEAALQGSIADRAGEPPAEQPGPAPAAVPVHVLVGEATVRSQGGRLIVEQPGEAPIERPLGFVSALHVHGWATVTSPCIQALLAQGTPVVWRSPSGYPIGYSAPLASAGLAARRQQYAAAEGCAGLAIARELVAARIENTREFLRRRTFDARDRLRRGLEVAARKALRARDLAALRGHEGAATALYFSAFDDLIGTRAGEFAFAGRSRRPPGDGVNAMLSYAYGVLAGECLCAAAASGLDPRLGFMHAERAGRPALALDLMEPFRPLVADAAVIGGLNRGQFNADDFSAGVNGVAMSPAARRTLIGLIEQHLDGQAVYHETSGFAQSYRQIIGLEARRLAHCLAQKSTFKAWRAA